MIWNFQTTGTACSEACTFGFLLQLAVLTTLFFKKGMSMFQNWNYRVASSILPLQNSSIKVLYLQGIPARLTMITQGPGCGED